MHRYIITIDIIIYAQLLLTLTDIYVSFFSCSFSQSLTLIGAAKAPYKLDMQPDGNLVQYDKDGVPVWNSQTINCRNIPTKMMLQDDGKMFSITITR